MGFSNLSPYITSSRRVWRMVSLREGRAATAPSPARTVLLPWGLYSLLYTKLASDSSVPILLGFWGVPQFGFISNKPDNVHNPLSETPGTSRFLKSIEFRKVIWFIYLQVLGQIPIIKYIIISAINGMSIHTKWDKLRLYHINSD